MLTLVVVVLVFAVHSRSTGPGSCPPTRAWPCCAPAGWPGAGRCASGSSTPRARRGRRPRRGRTPAGSRGSGSGCRRCARWPSCIVIAIALAASWTAYQPVRAVHAGDAAFDRLDQGQPEAAAEHRAHRHRAQPAVGRPAVRAGGDRGGARAHAGGRGRARARGRAAAGQRRGVAPARPPAAVDAQRPEGRAERLPGRLLPRSEVPGLDVGRDRGQPRRGYGRRAHAVRPGAARARPRSRRARASPPANGACRSAGAGRAGRSAPRSA